VRASDGLLLADKGPGLTSFQVVAHVRRVLRAPKVGHGGTLDPMATGVLPLLLGAATKLTPYLFDRDKEYVATVRLGVSTDSLDATGRVIAERPVPALDEGDLRAVLARFVGEIEQVPPMFSAVHVRGRRLYELARAGQEVERRPRRVRVDAIDLLAWTPPALTIRLACGKGTYVRSLAADLGQALGSGAHLAALRRTRVGPFRVEDAVPWEILRAGDAAVLAPRIVAADRAVSHLPAVRLHQAAARRLDQGQRVDPASCPAPWPSGLCRLYADDRFLGIGEAGPGGLRALRLLSTLGHADHQGPRPVSS